MRCRVGFEREPTRGPNIAELRFFGKGNYFVFKLIQMAYMASVSDHVTSNMKLKKKITDEIRLRIAFQKFP